VKGGVALAVVCGMGKMRDRPSEKIRDMSRSVLPSKARDSARFQKAALHRALRHRGRERLRGVGDLDSDEDYESRSGEIRDAMPFIVEDRRSADKLGAFLRWANAITDDIDDDVDKHFFVKSKLGSSVIKDHALGHFIHVESARNPFFRRSINDFPKKRNFWPCPWRKKSELLELVEEAIVLDHSGFNALLRKLGIQVVPEEPCADEPRKKCWRLFPVRYRAPAHDDEACANGGLLRCVARVPKATERAALPCWTVVVARGHDASACPLHRTWVEGPNEAKRVLGPFWSSRHAKPEMDPAERALAEFLAGLGLVRALRHGAPRPA
jgi:hypothetical protein